MQYAEVLTALQHQVDNLVELSNTRQIRMVWFSGGMPPHALELDELGIPQAAYYNTEGDTPVKAFQQVQKFGYWVAYVDDQVIDLVKQYLEAKHD